METQVAVDIANYALWNMLLVATPLLGAGVIVGLTIAIIQTATSIQEQTMTFAPKIIALIVVLMFFGGDLVEILVQMTVNLWDLLTEIGI